MPVPIILHKQITANAVKIFNNKRDPFMKPQITAGRAHSLAFICGIGYQWFALTNSCGFYFLLIISCGFYYTGRL